MRVLLVLVVVVAAVALVGGAGWYLRRRLVLDTTVEGRRRTWAMRAFAAVAFAFVVPLVASFALDGRPIAARSRLVYVGLSLLLYLLLALLVMELPRWLIGRRLRPSDTPTPNPDEVPVPTRRKVELAQRAGEEGGGSIEGRGPENEGRRLLLARSLAGTAGAVAVATTAFGYRQASRKVPPKHVGIGLERLPRELDGLRAALLADVHLTQGLRERGFMQEVVDTVNEHDVDLAFVVGDLMDGSVDDLRDAVAPLADLRATLGRYYATGNHEYYSGVEEWVEHLPTLGWEVLRNGRTSVRHRGAVLDIAGVDDVAGEQHGKGPDMRAALDGRDRERPVILLAHQPVLAEEAAEWDVDLVLSGHTHGGQLWPLGALVRAQQGHLAGLERITDRTQLYTTRGVGTWGPPVRVAAPPEVTIITLRAGA